MKFKLYFKTSQLTKYYSSALKRIHNRITYKLPNLPQSIQCGQCYLISVCLCSRFAVFLGLYFLLCLFVSFRLLDPSSLALATRKHQFFSTIFSTISLSSPDNTGTRDTGNLLPTTHHFRCEIPIKFAIKIPGNLPMSKTNS